LEEKDISWPTEKSDKFKQPSGFIAKPIYLSSRLNDESCELTLGFNKGYSNCKTYKYNKNTDGYGNNILGYHYWYPDDENTQYLYESFPNIISPVEGVTNEHFIVWMRNAGLPNFRKLYGKMYANSELNNNNNRDDNTETMYFQPGSKIIFDLDLNFEVASFGGTKALVISNLNPFFGSKAAGNGISNAFFIVGGGSLLLCVCILMKIFVFFG